MGAARIARVMYENRISRCSFQMMALSTRYANLLHALATDADIIISERSIESDRACFADVNLDTAEDVAAYSASHDALSGALPNDIKRATVFLHAPRSVLMQRIAKRGRECEEKLEKLIAEEEDPAAAGGVPEEYLARLDEAHERLWARTPKDARKWVDATRSEADVAEAGARMHRRAVRSHSRGPSEAGRQARQRSGVHRAVSDLGH